jgi:hypothetical protein
MSKHTLGDGPIDPRVHAMMEACARGLDEAFNGELKGLKRKTGFILMVFPFDDHGGRCNYISNANREDVVTLLKEQLARFEGQPDVEGKA